jgi:hypothetical protein
MTLKLQSTKVTEAAKGFVVEMILSSAADLETATDVVQLRATIDTNDRYPRLAKLQEVTLSHVQRLIAEEIGRIVSALATNLR